MKVPDSKTFYIRDVERLIGPDRLLDVMDVKTQKNLEMTLKEWCDYFLSSNRKELLNVISLEFSHTPLADYVEPPNVIKQLDWVNTGKFEFFVAVNFYIFANIFFFLF